MSLLTSPVRKTRIQAGFTLIEVMIALAILAGMLVLLLRGAASNVASTQRSKYMTAATELARMKMYDIEEVLLEEGFQPDTQEDEGTFKEQGWPQISWKSSIEKIELPNADALEGFSGGEDGEEGGESLGGVGGGGGLGGAIVGGQFEMIKGMMEESLRRVRLTISYKVAGYKDEFTVDCYFTDPAAIGRVNSLAAGGGQSGDDTEKETSSGGRGTKGGSKGNNSKSGGQTGPTPARGGR